MKTTMTMKAALDRGLVAAAMVVSGAAPLRAHETGVLRPATREFSRGGSVNVTGDKFPKGETLTLVLLGTRGRIELAKVRTDSAGHFEADLSIPGDAVEGAYRLVAFASDGDRVGAVDVAVVAAAPAPPAAGADEHAGHAAEAAEPSSEPLGLERARSGPVTVGAVALVLLAAVGGGLALRPSARAD